MKKRPFSARLATAGFLWILAFEFAGVQQAAAAEPGLLPPSADPRNFEGVWWPADGWPPQDGTPEREAQRRSPKPPRMREEETDWPFQPDAKRQYLKNIADDLAGKPRITTLIACRPHFDLLGNRFSFTVLQTSQQVTLLFEEDHAVRRIFMHAKHPEKLTPSYQGHSIGWWEGDTLVVDTIGFNDKVGFGVFSPNHSDQLHAVERIRKVDGGWRIEDDMTFTDPKTFTAPVRVQRYYILRTDQRMAEFICEEGERDAKMQGAAE